MMDINFETWLNILEEDKKNYKVNITDTPIIINENNKDNILTNISCFKTKQKFSYICKVCKKQITIYKKSVNTRLICSTCSIKETWKNKTKEELKKRYEKSKQTCLKKYGVENTSQLETTKEKIRATNIKRYGVPVPAQSKEVQEKAKQTCLERYGVEHSWQSEHVKEKIKDSLIEHYGVENAMFSEEVKETHKRSNLEKWGVENVYQAPEIKKKIASSIKERYGVEHALQNKELLNKAKKTTLKRFGVEIAAKSDIIKEKTKQICLKKYGGPSSLSSKEIREKAKQTCLKRYGVEIPMRSKIVQAKTRQTCLERYGVEHYAQTLDFFKRVPKKYIFNNETFNSSWELYFWIWATETGHNIKRETIKFEYEVEGKKHYYFPDFELDGQLIEIKGGQFFKKDKMINPYNRTMDGIFEAKHQCGILYGVKFITDISESKEYVDSKYTSDFVNLFRTNLEFPYPNSNLIDISDRGLIQYFHKSIWDAKVRNNPSPKEAWNDKELIYKVALNRLKYVGSCKPEDILRGFSVTKKAPKVSVFKPSLAKRIIETYASEYTTIFDPFSGFSGRMLGAIRNDKNYIGQDLSEVHIEESKALLNWIKENQGLNMDVDLKCQDILTDIERIFENTCLFTCSPYGSKETWIEGEVQMTCDEWIEVCLSKYKCNRYIFVVDETKKYKDYIVETLENKSHFGSNFEYIIKI